MNKTHSLLDDFCMVINLVACISFYFIMSNFYTLNIGWGYFSYTLINYNNFNHLWVVFAFLLQFFYITTVFQKVSDKIVIFFEDILHSKIELYNKNYKDFLINNLIDIYPTFQKLNILNSFKIFILTFKAFQKDDTKYKLFFFFGFFLIFELVIYILYLKVWLLIILFFKNLFFNFNWDWKLIYFIFLQYIMCLTFLTNNLFFKIGIFNLIIKNDPK